MSLADRAGATGSDAQSAPRLAHVILAFAAVYLIWGSTYLAIRWAIETMPPLLMAAVRFLVAGALLHGWQRVRGAPRPTAAQWKVAATGGALLLVGGNGAVVIAEQWVPSGLAALIVACVPMWMVVMDALFGSRIRPSARAWLGLVIGLLGVVLLAGSPGVGEGGPEELFGAVLLMGGSLCWAAGSIYTRYAKALPSPLSLVSMQMLAGGSMLLVLSGVMGDFSGLDLRATSVKSALSLAYLIVFGALVGYGAYIWLLRTVTPARAATYAYVNPVVAMLLGWSLAGEPLTFRSLGAAAIILGAVVLITTDLRSRQHR
jgi:drug/metabolite transporter (DMT)-like permease